LPYLSTAAGFGDVFTEALETSSLSENLDASSEGLGCDDTLIAALMESVRRVKVVGDLLHITLPLQN